MFLKQPFGARAVAARGSATRSWPPSKRLLVHSIVDSRCLANTRLFVCPSAICTLHFQVLETTLSTVTMEPSTQIAHTLPEDDGTCIGPSDTTGEATERCQDASLEAIISEDQQIQPESQEEPIEIDSVTEVSTEVTVTVTRQPPKKRGRPSKSATDGSLEDSSNLHYSSF